MKITFITGHNWETKRQGGFHVFAEHCALRGNETVFFSFPRPYYGLFMKREQLNKNIIRKLQKGAEYILQAKTDRGAAKCVEQLETGRGIAKILNVTFPTLRLPDAAGRFLLDFLMNFLATHSLRSFKSFARKFLLGTDCFVFESCEGIFLFPKIKKLFPAAKIIYRPSDPLVFGSVPNRLKKAEHRILCDADISLLVNEVGKDAYKKFMPDFDEKVKYKILPNGVDIEAYKKTYEVPELLKKTDTVLYVGAWQVEWPLLFQAVQKLPDANFIVVCPNYPSAQILERVEKTENLFYVPGIAPKEVPAWVTNCSVVMVPYETDFYKDRYFSITAKYYQAMAANKPVVAYCDTPELKKANIPVTYTYDDFIKEIEIALKKKNPIFTFDLKHCDWNKLCEAFLAECRVEDLKNN